MLQSLNPLFLSELRLAIMSILVCGEEADFLYLQKQTKATSGNLSVQLDKLYQANYIEIEKGFVGKRPRTTCRITKEGVEAFQSHYEALMTYFQPDAEEPEMTE